MAEILRRWGSIVAMRTLVALLAVTTSLAACGGESTSIDAGFETFFEAEVEPEFERTLAGLDEVERSDQIVPAEDTVEDHPPELRFRLATLATGCPDRLGDVASEDHERRYVGYAEQFRTED